jgi:CheY-like chemotaxis protein/anti-sigma regulatory factor (Ser/Thr protein kinase)
MSESEPKNILVVDDDRDLCRMLERYLTVKGFAVDQAYDGETALKLVPKKKYDLIILDIMMPGIDGYDVCGRLKTQREYNHIPIIMLSAKSAEMDIVTGFKTGADEYVTKPFEIQKLMKAVNETMEKRRRAREDLGVKHEIKFEFESRYDYLDKVNDLISQLFLRTDLAPDEIWNLKLAMHELGINAIEHGNKLDPSKQVKVFCALYSEKLEFIIEDEGEGFDPSSIPDPTAPEGIKRDRGRGIYLVSQLVDEIEYINGGSMAKMVRHLNRPRRAGAPIDPL